MFALASLADRPYQDAIWLRHEAPPGYEDDLQAAINLLYDDTQVLPDPRARLGSVLVPGDELERLRELGEVLEVLLDQHGDSDDSRYVADPRWGEVTRAAAQALAAIVRAGAYCEAGGAWPVGGVST